jgi:hypothetical protein
MQINEDKAQAVCFFHRRRPVDVYLTLKGRHILFVNSMKYLGETSDKKITHRNDRRQTLSKIYWYLPFLKIECLSVNKKINTLQSID